MMVRIDKTESFLSFEEVRKLFYKKICNIPNFIDGKKYVDKIVWDIIFMGSEIILLYVWNDILNPSEILHISDDYNKLMDGLGYLKYQIEAFAYHNLLVQKLIEICIENQLFESCENLNKFYTLNFI